MQFRLSDRRLRRKFRDSAEALEIQRYQVGERTLRYLAVGDSSLPMIVFLHGAPGSSKDFFRYLQDSTLQRRARLIAVDRPGYGYSGFGRSMTSLEEQAQCIAPLLDLNRHERPPILVGHSYGGPLVARLAMDYPDKASGPLLFLAAALDPNHEKMFWVNRPFNSVLLSWMLPRSFRVANDEKMSHVAELEKMKALWPKLKNQASFMHGYNDNIVPVENSLFAAAAMPENQVDTLFPAKMSHMFIWNKYDLVKNKLLELLESESQ